MPILLAVITAFTVTFILLPIIIKVSRSIDLLDAPDRRKIHDVSTPALGGVGIFIGSITAASMVIPFNDLADLKYLFFALLIIFFMGLRDDISSLVAKHKLFAQIFAAFLVVYVAGIRLDGLYGMFGITDMPEWFNISLTMFVIVALTNSFNLIDGIDGLAGSIGILILTFLGLVFLAIGQDHYGVFAFSVAGAVFAFLFFNWSPSKVFMGDTGSMLLGFVISSLTIEFINIGSSVEILGLSLVSTVGLAIALLIVPIYDTLRVFTIRFVNGKNPLDPDRNHLHHGLLKLGMNHSQATITLLTFNLSILMLALLLDAYLSNLALAMTMLISAAAGSSILEYKLVKKKYMGKESTVQPKADLYISKSA